MAYDLAKLRLLARGGQADIYEIDSGHVLRVLRAADPDSAAMLAKERAIMAELKSRGVGVPEVFELTQAGGLPAFAMERVAGPSMMDRMARAPFGIRSFAQALAGLHASFLSTEAPDALQEIKGRAGYLVGHAELLDDEDRAFVLSLLPELPEGRALLHGDFHPGNILIQDGRYFIIDWFGATKGDPVSDIAHSYLLCADKPRIPGESEMAYRLIKPFAVMFGGQYLKQIRKAMPFDMAQFGKWLAVRAAERSVYGQPLERTGRAAFVKACRRAGTGSEAWHKFL